MLDVHSFADNVYKYRTLQHFTQLDVAKKLFVSPQTISKWENGLATPDLWNLANLAETLGVTIDQLLGSKKGAIGNRTLIGIDGGGTKTDFCLFREDGVVLRRIILGGVNPNAVGIDNACRILKLGIDQLLTFDADVVGLFAGIAGAENPNNGKLLRQFFQKQYPRVNFEVESDIFNVILSVRGITKCTACICGTGSVVYGTDGTGFHQVGGYGYLFDGAGSGYDIGRDVIRECLCMHDGIAKPSLVTELAEKKLGDSVPAKLDMLYSRGIEYIASFSTVAFDAYRKGDPAAEAILRRNFRQLAGLIQQIRAQYDCGSDVIVSGGITANRAELISFLTEELGDEVTITIPKFKQIYGACAKSARLCGITVDDAFDENFRRTLTE